MSTYKMENKVELTGQVCKGVAEYATKNGKVAIDFSLNVKVSTQQIGENGMLEKGPSKSGFVNCVIFVPQENADAARQAIAEGQVVTVDGRILPSEMKAEGSENVRRNFKLQVNEVKPYVKAAEGEVTNLRNNVKVSGYVCGEPKLLGKKQNLISFSLAVEQESKTQGKQTYYFSVQKPFKEEDRDKYVNMVKKGKTLTMTASFDPWKTETASGMNLRAYSVEQAVELTNDEQAEKPKEQAPFDKAKEIEKQPSLAQALKDKGVDPMSLSDKQVQKMFWFHSPLEISTPQGRFNFTQTKNDDKTWAVQAERVQQQQKAAQEEAER